MRGVLFFVAVENFLAGFDHSSKIPHIVIDLSHASLRDSSAIGAIDKVITKFRRNGAKVDVIPSEGEGRALLDRLAMHHEPGAGKTGY